MNTENRAFLPFATGATMSRDGVPRVLCDDECVTHCPLGCGVRFNVMRPSQHGEEEKVLAEDFETSHEAEAWIEAHKDTHPYLPYVEQAP